MTDIRSGIPILHIPEIRADVFRNIEWDQGQKIYYLSRMFVSWVRDWWPDNQEDAIASALKHGFLECLTPSEIRYALSVDINAFAYHPRSARLLPYPECVSQKKWLRASGSEALRWAGSYSVDYQIFSRTLKKIQTYDVNQRDLSLAIEYNYYPMEVLARFESLHPRMVCTLTKFHKDLTDDQILKAWVHCNGYSLAYWLIDNERNQLLPRLKTFIHPRYAFIVMRAAERSPETIECVLGLVGDVPETLDLYCRAWCTRKLILLKQHKLTFDEYPNLSDPDEDHKLIGATELHFYKISLDDVRCFQKHGTHVYIYDLSRVPAHQHEAFIATGRVLNTDPGPRCRSQPTRYDL